MITFLLRGPQLSVICLAPGTSPRRALTSSTIANTSSTSRPEMRICTGGHAGGPSGIGRTVTLASGKFAATNFSIEANSSRSGCAVGSRFTRRYA